MVEGPKDETRTFDKGKADLTKIGDTTISRMYLELGWSWEKCSIDARYYNAYTII